MPHQSDMNERKDMSSKQISDMESPFEEEVSLYAYWSLAELHNLARELDIPNYEKLNRETLIELMIRRLF